MGFNNKLVTKKQDKLSAISRNVSFIIVISLCVAELVTSSTQFIWKQWHLIKLVYCVHVT